MKPGWGVLSLGAVANEEFREFLPRIVAVGSVLAPKTTGATMREFVPGLALVASINVPGEHSIHLESPPKISAEAVWLVPHEYIQVNEWPPTIGAEAKILVPSDAGISLLAPRAIFYGYEFDGTSLSIPIADLIGLSVEEADAVTGDWREVLQAILLTATEYHRSFQWSIQPRTYNPFGMNLLNSRTFDRHFGITFYVDMGEANVAPEP